MIYRVFHNIFLITCTGFILCQRQQTALLHLNLLKLPHRRYSLANHLVSEVYLIGYASYFNKKLYLSSKLISRSEKTHLWTSQLNFCKEHFRRTTIRKQLLTGLISGCNLISCKATKYMFLVSKVKTILSDVHFIDWKGHIMTCFTQ